MEYPWNTFLIEAAEPKDPNQPDPDTGTNEPVDPGDVDTVDPTEQPDPSLAEDLVTGDTGELQAEVDDLKKQIEELTKKFDLETEVEQLKKRLDNVSVPDDTDLNDSINQSASREIKYIKRAVRRFLMKNKTSGLTGSQQQRIISELEKQPDSSCQQISSQLAKELEVSEQDIFDFIRNSDYRFRHRHWREASVIDWDFLD
jgi:exonuclease VII large subunit